VLLPYKGNVLSNANFVKDNPDVSEDHTYSTFRVEERAKQETNRSRRKFELTCRYKIRFHIGYIQNERHRERPDGKPHVTYLNC
jgi:hypothetical protein